MTKHSAVTSGRLVYVDDDNQPRVIPPGECEIEQRPADNSYIVRWKEEGASRVARLSAMQYFDLVRTKRLLVQSERKGGASKQ